MPLTHPVGEQYPVSQKFLQEDDFTRKTYKSGVHFGLDIACRNVALYAPCDGKIGGIVRNHASLGNCIYFEENGHWHRFLHLSEILVTEGQSVKQGQHIGVTGNTGMGGSYHLHWDIQKMPFKFENLLSKAKVQESMLDPLLWLKQPTPTLAAMSLKELLQEALKRV